MLDKTYLPRDVEAGIYDAWEASGAFEPAGDGEPFCVMLPPPNVTGSLHIGHALDHTIQDVLCRFMRMRGRRVLWQPGTDHAGIATQMMVERKLAAEGKDRREMGREAFLEEVWRFKENSGGTIQRQMRRLGQSPAWARERFTLDEGLSRAVTEAFVRLHDKGLIYRAERLVNWDVQLQTALSDLEVEQREVNGKLWHFRYPIEGADPDRDGEAAFVTVATTRPETMLGDTAVAVHPDDGRYRRLHGRFAILPLVGRRIPIVADEYSDPEKGSGAVKITPAHDFNDFEVGRRHGLEAIPILDGQGRVNGNAPEAYRGLDRFEARARVVEAMEAAGLLAKVEDNRHAVPHGDRSGTPVEPYLTLQWYLDAARLAGPAISAAEQGRTRFVPAQWANTYFEWLRNIQPWCISRQLWWGHRIPAWHGPDGSIFVARTEEEARAQAEARFGAGATLERDPDVLDTWFSSGLWPFSTLGWPDQTPALEEFYPTDVLVTGFDIIFFWVARMMMQGLELTGEVPFADVYIHGLVRDEKNQKMSKTKGNVVDPLELADLYGADALRYSLMASVQQGRDVKFGASKVESYRNFVTKLWNAARFLEMNEAGLDPGFEPAAARHRVNRWIVSITQRAVAEVTSALDAYRFSEAAVTLQRFVRISYCDWYLELAKPLLQEGDEATRAETRAAAAWAFERLLKLMHPFAPFVTERLWRDRLGAPGGMLIAAPWPRFDEALIDAEAEDELDWLTGLIGGVRAARAQVNVPPSARLNAVVTGGDGVARARFERHADALARLARVDQVEHAAEPPAGAVLQVVANGATVALPVAGVIDVAAERARLTKKAQASAKEIGKLEGKLANPKFVERADPDAVEDARERLGAERALLALLERAVDKLRA